MNKELLFGLMELLPYVKFLLMRLIKFALLSVNRDGVMKKMIKLAALCAGIGLAVVSSSSAHAASQTLNIIDYIDGGASYGSPHNYAGVGESTTTQLDFNLQGIKVDALGTLVGTPNTSADPYLDGGNAGLGVCSGGASGSPAQCDTASDDNVGIGDSGGEVQEILSISLDSVWNIEDLYFRNEGHTADFYNDDNNAAAGSQKLDVAVDGVDLGNGVGAYVTYVLEDVSGGLGATLVGWDTLYDLSTTAYIHLKNNTGTDPRTQFYLSGILISDDPDPSVPEIPLPAGFLLMLSGLLGLGFLGRFKAKSA